MIRVNNTYRSVNLNNRNNAVNTKIVRRILIAAVIFLLLNILLFLPPVQKRIEEHFFSNMKNSGMLENAGIAAGQEGQADEETVRKSLETCLVQIQQSDAKGSGIIWDMNEQEAVLVTAAHVVVNAQDTAQVTFYNGRQADADVIYMADNADVAFLSIRTEELESLKWADYTYVKLDEERETDLQAEDELLLLWDNSRCIYAKVLNPMLYMEDFGENMIWAEATAVHGMSGSGVFDSRGNLMGILCGGNEQNEIAVLPVSTIRTEYEKSGRNLTR